MRASPSSRGTITSDGDGRSTIVFVRRYRHSIEHVWDAVSTPEGLREWLLCTRATIDGRVGGHIELVSGPAQYHSRGTILAWTPPRLLEYEWNVAPVPEMPLGENAIFRYELSPDGDGTLLVVTYTRLTQATARGFVVGVHALLERLDAQLDRRPLPDFHSLFASLGPHYPEWSEHASHSGK